MRARSTVYAFNESELAGGDDAELLAQLQRRTGAVSARDAQAQALAIEYLQRKGVKMPTTDDRDQ